MDGWRMEMIVAKVEVGCLWKNNCLSEKGTSQAEEIRGIALCWRCFWTLLPSLLPSLFSAVRLEMDEEKEGRVGISPPSYFAANTQTKLPPPRASVCSSQNGRRRLENMTASAGGNRRRKSNPITSSVTLRRRRTTPVGE